MDLSPWLPSGSRSATAGGRTVQGRITFGPAPRASCQEPIRVNPRYSGLIRVIKKIKKLKPIPTALFK